MNSPTALVSYQLQQAKQGKIGIIEMQRPKAINALNGEMAEAICEVLTQWEQDPSVAAVVLSGQGPKGFCAGGDVKQIHQLASSIPDSKSFLKEAGTYFRKEYSCDLAIHHYSKPLLIWGHGLIFGGGWGLFAGASHRVVTPSTQLCMPEILIGLFPDVAASWFLNRLPYRLGTFLTMTASRLRANDAIGFDLADYLLEESALPDVLGDMADQYWSSDSDENSTLLSGLLQKRTIEENQIASPASDHLQHLKRLSGIEGALAYAEAVLALESDDPWITTAKAQLKSGSPSSVVFTYHFMRKTRHFSLRECFALDWQLAMHMAESQEFLEGVRAMLVDKDMKPSWRPKSLKEVETGWIEAFLTQPVPGFENPFK